MNILSNLIYYKLRTLNLKKNNSIAENRNHTFSIANSN